MSNQSRAFQTNAFDRSDGFRDDENGHARHSAGRKLELVSRSDFVDSSAWENFPNAADHVAETDRSSDSQWSTTFAWMMEGFLLYGASLHPTSAFPTELFRTERNIPQPARVSPSRRSGSVASTGVVRRLARQSRRFVTGVWINWRREREIKRAVSALAQFDDRSLRDMGIPSRSSIEHVVRYCRDC
jgi:uncharacterized protein YjiS (DUF1127 family)